VTLKGLFQWGVLGWIAWTFSGEPCVALMLQCDPQMKVRLCDLANPAYKLLDIGRLTQIGQIYCGKTW